MMESIGKKEKQERLKKIQEYKYNKIYRKMITEEISEYLYKRKKRKDRRLITRFRSRNEMLEDASTEDEERKCRICVDKVENIMHVLRECKVTMTKYK